MKQSNSTIKKKVQILNFFPLLRTQFIFQHPIFCTYHRPNFHLPEGRVQCLEIVRALHFVFLPPRKRGWLRYYATSLKVKGSIPEGVTGIFH